MVGQRMLLRLSSVKNSLRGRLNYKKTHFGWCSAAQGEQEPVDLPPGEARDSNKTNRGGVMPAVQD